MSGINENNETAENYPLDDAVIAMMSEIAEAQKNLEKQALSLAAQRQGALVLFVRQHKLQGNWQLAENGRELVRQPEAAPAPAAPEGGRQ